MLENQFKKKVSKELRSRKGVYVYSVVDRVTAGIPDFILCYKGRFIGLELKCNDRPVTAAQKFWARQIVEAGGKYIVMRHTDESILVGDPLEVCQRAEESIQLAVDWVLL
jgi:hypothetical protein